jgi:hypothetical protein
MPTGAGASFAGMARQEGPRMMTADRCAKLARDLREHIDPGECNECAALATLADGLVQLARNGFAGPMCEHLLAQALREVAR